MMQPAQPATSPWPKRILIAGCALAFLGFILYFGQAATMESYIDPRESSEHQVEFGAPATIELTDGCWVVSVAGATDHYDVEYLLIENGSESGPIKEDCRTDYQPQAADGTTFTVLTTLDIEKDSTVKVTITCDEADACEEPVLFTDGNVIYEMFANPGILITVLMCCLGVFMIPFGFVLMMMVKNRAAKVQLTQQQMVTAMTPLDELAGTNQQDMLTTEQIYQMMRGEIPDQQPLQKDVPSPFADADTRPTTKPAAKKTGGSINIASNYTHENPPTDESWKSWDEA